MNPLFRIDFSISDSLKIVRKSVLIYETIIELPHGIVEETARQCIQMNSCRYKTFKQVLNRVISTKDIGDTETLPSHENIRGKGFYK